MQQHARVDDPRRHQFECADCGHQTSLTSGTLLEKTSKPFKMWFRAVFEISDRRTGISAKDLQRIMGFGSYKTAWSWLHKLRAAMVRSDSEPLGPFVQIDEALVGGKGGPHKELVLVAAEANGRVRLAHAENNDEGHAEVLRRQPDRADTHVVTDGHASYNSDEPRRAAARGDRADQGRAARERRLAGLPLDDFAAEALAARHACRRRAAKHLQAYLDEFAFRHNRRKTNGVGRIAARVIEQLVARAPLTMRKLIDETPRCRWFASAQYAAA